MYFADEELSPGTPPSGHERITFQPMLDLQRFQQYVAEEQSKHPEHPIPTLLTGSGASHVPPSNSIGVGQATIPSTDGIKVADEDSGLFHEGRGTDHVAAHGGMVVGRDYSSQPPSFLSQGSSGTVIAGGPNFVKPGGRMKHSLSV